MENAQSLDAVREALLEVSGDYDESPFDKGVSWVLDSIKELSTYASGGVAYDKSGGNRPSQLINQMPDVLRPHVRTLYKQAVDDAGSEIDYEV